MRKVIFLTIFVFVLAGNNIFAQELKKEIEIDPKDQICEKDADCTVIETSCLRVACDVGKPVNIHSKNKYDQALKDCRQKSLEAHQQMMCDAVFYPYSVKCLVNRCQIIIKSDKNEDGI